MKRITSTIVFTLLIGILVFTSQLQASNLDWKVYETDHFIIYFHDGYQFQAQETAYYLEQNYTRVRELTGNDREFKTQIIVQDVGIESNGYADPIFNQIAIFTNSPQDGALRTYQNWFRLVAGHELTHIQQMTNYSGAGAIQPMIFGDIMAPNVHVPMWIIEGVTVYSESQITPYEGRLNDGYYDAVLAAKVSANQFPSILEANYVHNYYPTGQYYLFGGAFIRYLAETYGQAKVTEFFDEQGRNIFALLGRVVPAVGVDRSAKKVFGKSFATLFQEWEAVEVAQHQDWKIDGQLVLANHTYGTIDNLLTYQGKLYFTKMDLLMAEPSKLEGALALVEFDPTTGQERVLKEFSSNLMGKVQLAQGKIYYVVRETESGFANVEQLGFGATGRLYSYDLSTGQTEFIMEEGLKAFEVMSNGQILYTKDRQTEFGSEVWKYANNQKILLGTLDEKVAEIEMNQDHLLIVSRKNLGGWNINQFNLADLALHPLVATPWAETAITLEGDQVYYSANYDKEWAQYTYDLTTHEVTKLTQGGYAFNGLRINDQLYFKGLVADGDAIFKKAIHPVPYQLGHQEIVLAEPIAEFAQGLQEQDGLGKNFKEMIIPKVRFFPVEFSGADALGVNNYDLRMSSYGGYDFTLSSTMAQPLQVTVINQKISRTERLTSLGVTYPLYNSNQFGLTNVTVGGTLVGTEDLAGTVLATFRAPRQSMNLQLIGDLQGSLDLYLGYRHPFNQKNLSLQGNIFTNVDKMITYRGMNTFWVDQAQGVAASGEYTVKLAEIRKGFWQSTLFLSDLYGGAFVDYTSLAGGQISGGVNCKLEMGMGFLLNTVPELGVVVDQTGTVNPYFEFSMGY